MIIFYPIQSLESQYKNKNLFEVYNPKRKFSPPRGVFLQSSLPTISATLQNISIQKRARSFFLPNLCFLLGRVVFVFFAPSLHFAPRKWNYSPFLNCRNINKIKNPKNMAQICRFIVLI